LGIQPPQRGGQGVYATAHINDNLSFPIFYPKGSKTAIRKMEILAGENIIFDIFSGYGGQRAAY
jgi:hypothetical protein